MVLVSTVAVAACSSGVGATPGANDGEGEDAASGDSGTTTGNDAGRTGKDGGADDASADATAHDAGGDARTGDAQTGADADAGGGADADAGGNPDADAGGGPDADADVDAQTNLGWTGQENIETIFTTYCANCHGTAWASCWDDQTADQTLSSVIQSGFMPRGTTMTAADKSTVLNWLDAGAPCTGTPPGDSGTGTIIQGGTPVAMP
jgi:hypothetical protein